MDAHIAVLVFPWSNTSDVPYKAGPQREEDVYKRQVAVLELVYIGSGCLCEQLVAHADTTDRDVYKRQGYEKPVAGEVVFNTAMMGYPESLTDPSYAGQLMVLTFPLVGNYGVPPFSFEPNGLPTFMESDRIYASAIIVADYSEQYSHWNAKEMCIRDRHL